MCRALGMAQPTEWYSTLHAYVSKTVETIQLKSKISTLESHSSLLTHQLKLEVIYNHNLSLF